MLQYIYHACATSNGADGSASGQAACEHGNTGGNTIYDGGGDMYDIGNIIVTSLMQNPAEGANSEATVLVQPNSDRVAQADCYLGSIRYETNFEPIQTTCFGPGGYYEMAEMAGNHHNQLMVRILHN